MAEKILLVDDDTDTLRLVGLMLQRQGYEILAANNGQQAINLAEVEKPDLVLLDVMMPEMDGYEVARRLRSNPTTTNIPIIMFTAKSQVDDKVLGFDAGADDYLTKPTQPRELFAHLKAVLSRSQKSTSAVSTEADLTEERGVVIGLIGCKGGIGVTTVALNLGFALRRQFDKEIIICELRPGQGTIGLDLGHTKADGLNGLLQLSPTDITKAEIEKRLVLFSSGVHLLLSSPNPADVRDQGLGPQYEVIVKYLSRMADLTLLDLGSSINFSLEKIYPSADFMVIILEPTLQSIVQTTMLENELSKIGVAQGRIFFVINNRMRSDMMLTRSQIEEKLGHRISVLFTPAPELAFQASQYNRPLILQQPESVTAQQYYELAAKILSR